MGTRRFVLIAATLILGFVTIGHGQVLDLFPPVANDDSGTTSENIALAINVVANDSDPDPLGGINAATVDLNVSLGGIQNSTSTAQGSFVVNASGVVTCTPANNFAGIATLGYTVNDNAGKTSNVATITITVEALPNNSPVANNDNATTAENTPVTINVVANDTDSDGTVDPATVDLDASQSGVQNTYSAAQGNYAANSSGDVTFTPANNFSGNASIDYTVKDTEGATSNAAIIAITVNAMPNAMPVANNDVTTTNENTPVTINVVANDTDGDGTINPATVDLDISQGGIQNMYNTAQGNYTANSSGVVTFTPANNFSGNTSIDYTVKDNEGATSNAAIIAITVNAVPNSAPLAHNDNATTTENSPVTINVVANDTDSDGTIDAATVDLNTAQSGIQSSRSTPQGNYTANASGVVTYTPAAGFSGSVSLSYTVNDNEGIRSNVAVLSITVDEVPNAEPVANNDNATTQEGTPVTINVLANDADSDGTIDPATVDLNTSQVGIQNSRSTAVGNFTASASGVVTFTPAANVSGSVSIPYTVNDNEGATSNAATIAVTVNAIPNTAPVANNDNATTSENTSVTINVAANDTDSDGTINPATVDLNATQTGIQNSRSTPQGSYSVNASGVVTYTPAAGFFGSTSISYKVNDNRGAISNVATITITVNAVPNAAPVANDDNATTGKNKPVTINVAANDTDSDGTINPATVDLNTSQGGIQNASTTAQGTYSVNASAVVTFVPANNYLGTASLTYQVSDNDGAPSNVATITIIVNAIANIAPVAEPDQTTTQYNTPVTIDIVANDTDSDGTVDASSVDINTSAPGVQKNIEVPEGNFIVSLSGVVTFTPATTFSGTASISYTVNDNQGAVSNAAAIKIDVGIEPVFSLDIPTAFTPNGDGANETWKIRSGDGQTLDEFQDAEIRVFSKRGVLVYEAKGFGEQWDGVYNGKALPPDTYYFTIDLNHAGIRHKGVVTILR